MIGNDYWIEYVKLIAKSILHIQNVGARQDWRRFPSDFLWGVATAAFQVEGGVEDGGRGPSIWDAWAADGGMVGTPVIREKGI